MLDTSPSELRPDWWRTFAGSYWERRPLAVSEHVAPSPPGAPALFDAVLGAVSSPLYRPRSRRAALLRHLFPARTAPRRHVGVRFLVESDGLARRRSWALASAVAPSLLPRATDRDFDGYHRRIHETLNPRWRRALGLAPRRYGLIVNNLESTSPVLSGWLRDFLRALYAEVGMNVGGVYLALFIGDYLRTPFGVHQDPESVFSFPIVGDKTMRTWPSRYAAGQPSLHRAQHYARHLGASVAHRARAPGFLYWPSDSWHVAEGDDALSVSLALGLVLPREGAEVTVPFRDDAPIDLTPIPRGLRPFEGRTSEEHWVCLATAMGCLHPLEPSDVRLPSRGGLALSGKIAHLVGADGVLVVGANGHPIRTADVDAARATLDRLSRGEIVDIADARASGREVSRVLEHVLRSGAGRLARGDFSERER